MPVSIDIYDFRCYNQLSNGSDFTQNTGLSPKFTPNLVGNIGEKVRLRYKVNLAQTANSEGLEEWFVDSSENEIVRSTGSFLDDSVQVGDKFGYYSDWENRKTGASLEFTGSVTFVSSDGKRLKYTVTVGTAPAKGNYSNVGLAFDQTLADNRNTALFLSFGLLGNDETFNNISKVSENQQIYYVGELTPGGGTKQAERLGTIRDWATGQVQVSFSVGDPDWMAAEYTIFHDFIITPFYLLAYRAFIDAGTTPELLAGDNSLKYAVQLEFRKTLTDTASSKVATFDNLDGFTGWYGENFNGLNPDYEIVSVVYEDNATGDPLSGINISIDTKVTITVSKLTGLITDYNCGAYFIRVPNSEDAYVNTLTDQVYNFMYKAATVTDPATSATNINTSIVGGDLVIEFTLSFTTAEKLRLTTSDEFMLFVQVEDSSIPNSGNSDRLMLIADLRNFIDVNYLAEFVEVSSYGFLIHSQELDEDTPLSTLTASNEDGILLDALIGVDVTKDVVINAISCQLLAYDTVTGETFLLDDYPFNLGDPVIVSGVQEIEIDTTRGYPLPVGDEFNLVRINTGAQIGDFQQYRIAFGQKLKWQEWLRNPNVDDVFFDAAEPNNNLNFKSSNYSNKNNYQIRLATVLNITGVDDLGRLVTGDYIHLGGAITVEDYEETTDGVTGIIETFDVETGNSLDGNILYNGKDTLFRSVFQNAELMQFGIHRIEPSQNPGDGIQELSSLLLPRTDNLLKPLPGEDKLKFTLVGTELTLECLVDGSLIEEGVNYKLSSRVGSIPLESFTFETSIQPTGVTPFNPSIVYGGSGSPIWSFENGYTVAASSLNDTDGSATGLDGTLQTVTVFVASLVDITEINFESLELENTLDLIELEGLTDIVVSDNNLTSFDFFKGSTFTRILVDRNNIANNQSLNGATFDNASLDFGNNNIANIDLSGTSGDVAQFGVNNNILSGSLNLDLLNFSAGARIEINNNSSLTGFTYTQGFNRFIANNCSIADFDLGSATAYGNSVFIKGSSNGATSWAPPTMDGASTLREISISDNPGLTGAFTDGWVSNYDGNADVFLNGSGFSSVTISGTGAVSRLRAFEMPNVTTINLSSMVLRASGFDLGINDNPNLSSYTPNAAWSGEKISTFNFGSNPNLNTSIDLSGFDMFDSSSNPAIGRINAINNNYTDIILPVGITSPIRSLVLENATDDNITYDFTGLGAGAFDQNGTAITLNSSVATVAEVNRMLVEIDGVSSGGFTGRILEIAGSCPAPDSSTGGNNGTAAVSSLISKGFTVVTN